MPYLIMQGARTAAAQKERQVKSKADPTSRNIPARITGTGKLTSPNAGCC